MTKITLKGRAMDAQKQGTRLLQSLMSEKVVSRRSFMRLVGLSATIPVASTLLAACGEDDATDDTAVDAPDDTDDADPAAPDETDDAEDDPDTADDAEPDDTEDTEDDAPAGEPQSGGILNTYVIEDPDSMDPAGTIQATASSVQTHIYDRLVYISEDRVPEPWVAEDWDVSDDGTELTFHIREGVLFHDGTDLDGEAVAASFSRILDPDRSSPALAQMGTLQEVEATDDYTAVFRFEEPYAPFYTNIAISYGGIVSPTAAEEQGDAFGRNPVGSGPFQFKEWPTGQAIILERFEDYVNYRGDDDNDGAAYVDEVHFNVISDVSTRLAALQSGELDISDVDRNQAPQIEEDPELNMIRWEDATNHNFLEFVDREPFNYPEVRQAIACCIDRETIVEAAYNGYASPNLLPMPTGLAGWDEEIGLEHGYPYDLDRAQQILEDAGWEPDNDGVLTDGEHRLEFTLLYYSGNEPIRVSCEILQATLESIGMSVELEVMEFGAMQGVIESGDFDVNWMRWTWPDPVILSLLFKSPGWVGQVSDDELDGLLNEADAEMDPDERINKVQTALEYILEEAIVAPILTDWILIATGGHVHGYRLDALGAARFVDVWLEQ
jgi:peptide/nickel transport system substrate-binding protein